MTYRNKMEKDVFVVYYTMDYNPGYGTICGICDNEKSAKALCKLTKDHTLTIKRWKLVDLNPEHINSLLRFVVEKVGSSVKCRRTGAGMTLGEAINPRAIKSFILAESENEALTVWKNGLRFDKNKVRKKK